MKRAIQHAVKTHPSGLAQISNSRAVANELDAARKRFTPELNIFGDLAGQNVHNPSSLSASDNGKWHASRQIGISANFLLFDGYERENLVYREAARLDAALLDVLSTSESVALSAAEVYIDVVRHRDLLHIARRNIKRHKSILRQIKERVRGGKSPASDAFQIEERVYAAQAVKVEIEKAYTDTLAKYRKIIGRKARGKMSIPRAAKLPRRQQTLIDHAIANNYRIKSARKVISQNEYSQSAVEGALMPRLSVEGRASIGADRGGSSGEERDAYIGLKLAWKIYDGGVNDSQIAAAAERVGQAQQQVDLLVREVRESAQLSWNAYHNGRRRASLINKQVQINKRIVRNYLEEYDLSKRSLLDVLDAERALFNGRFQYISASAAAKFAAFRMLASKSRLASYFGVSRHSLVPEANLEQKFVESSGSRSVISGQNFFNINIEPLK